MSPRRLLVVWSYTDLGGGETSLMSGLAALDRARVQPLLLTRAEGQVSRTARAHDIEVDILPFRGAPVWFVPPVWARLPTVRAMAARIRRLSADVVYCDFHALPFAAAACAIAGVPLIFYCWGWWFRPRAWQRRFYRERIHAILAGSEAIKHGFLGSDPCVPPDRVRVLHPGVDHGRFRPRPDEVADTRRRLNLPVDGPVITLVARFQHVKGHDVFLDAARLVLRAMPAATFAVAGEHLFGHGADAAYKRRIVSEVDRDPVLAPRVRMLGWVGDPESLLAASDVVVCSSRFETFGMVGIEAMSCGVPIVSTNVGGPSETIVDGDTGYLVPPDRPDAIADRVLTLLADPGRRRAMGEAGRARAVAHFSLVGFARGLEAAVWAVTTT